jgi:hypothetical protein
MDDGWTSVQNMAGQGDNLAINHHLTGKSPRGGGVLVVRAVGWKSKIGIVAKI